MIARDDIPFIVFFISHIVVFISQFDFISKIDFISYVFLLFECIECIGFKGLVC